MNLENWTRYYPVPVPCRDREERPLDCLGSDAIGFEFHTDYFASRIHRIKFVRDFTPTYH